MSIKGRIKIIKKGTDAKKPVGPVAPKYEAQRTVREMGATVSDWIAEIQIRKREESRMSFKELFGGGTQKSEA